MKQVTISTSMDSPSTRASLDSETGAFSWQSGDLISVLATDGNFYDFILESGVGNYEAEFVGSIPENAYVTTVATYPRIVSNGSANTVLVGSTLNYNLPATWTYVKDVSNVPMVAAFSENATHMAFKQVGGVMRFPVKNMPTEAKFIITMEDKTITGAFPVDINNLGTSAMTAGSSASELVINYSSEIDGAYAEFNVPVPTGTYNNFTLTIKDANDKVLFTKEYTSDINKVERATLLNMKEITLPERPMAIEVWPFFVDARVVFSKVEGVTDYAFYIDGSETPVILEAEEVITGQMGTLIGGEFKHNTTHTVAVAKVVDGAPVLASKSEAVSFTTADVYQMTQNTGTKFVTAGWDDVSIPNGTKYENGKWNLVPKLDEKYGLKGHQRRGYQVQLLAADKTTVIYDLIPFCGHEAFTGAFSDSSWLGKVNGNNIIIPTALAFGYLEPGKDYYFRVKTLDEAVVFDETNGNYIPADDNSQPYPYTLLSERGGCAWSEPVKLSTDAAHVASENEILYEGFDDIMVHSDYLNWAPAVVPDMEYSQTRISFADYCTKLVVEYPAFLKKPASERKWTTQAFSKQYYISELGILNAPHVNEEDNLFNGNLNTLEGWSYNSNKSNRTVMPIFGAVRIGQSGSSNNGATLKTPAITSDKLLNNKGTKCKITVNIAYCATNYDNQVTATPLNLIINQWRDGGQVGTDNISNVNILYPEEYASWVTAHNIDKNNYAHHQRFYEVSCELYMRNGDQLSFTKPTNGNNKGFLVIGDIKVEVIPGAYEQNDFVDDGVGTQPDDTNYDGFGLNGEFPISFWWNIPTAAHNYDAAKTLELYQDMKDAGINIVNYVGELDYSFAENKRIMDVCTELGMKFIGNVGSDANGNWFSNDADRIATIKEHFASNPTYVGEYLVDEPKATEFDRWGQFAKDYLQQIPDKEPYINLYPTYASTLGTSSYEAYIEEYLDKIPSKTLSYDFYGLPANGGNLVSDYYLNLDVVRRKTLDKRMPFWVITQAGEVSSRKLPTEKEQRWSVWSNLAGGSKGIAYFCYWTPATDKFSDVHYMVKDGEKTEMYDYIKKVNGDVQTIGKKLMLCHADGLILSNVKYYPVFDNAGQGRTNYGPVKAVSAVSDHVAVGCFRDARISESGDNYKGYKVLVVAQNPAKTIQTRLTLDPSVTTIKVTQNNVEKTVEFNNLLDVTVADSNGVHLTYADGKLTLDIPEGEALLIEF